MKNENTKHTPGPWNIYGNELSPVISISEDGTKPALAKVSGRDMQANARLIAAAPELLEACESLKSCLESWVEIAGEEDHRDYDSEALEIAREAIAKATGGAS